MGIRRRVFTLLFSFAVLAVSCKTVRFGPNAVDINGMIYDFSNRPVAYCEILLGGRYRASSDINGRFSLPNVRVGDYTLEGHKDGFEKYADEVSVRERGQIIYIRLPSQNQLLALIDAALVANNIPLALEMAERAYQIDANNVETLFYFATVKFKQGEYAAAAEFLEAARALGSRDIYIDKFLSQLKEMQYGK